MLPRRAWDEDGCQVLHDEEMASSPAEHRGAGASLPAAGRRSRVALLLNSNAKKADASTMSKLRALVEAEDTYVCCSLEDAAVAVRKVLQSDVYAALACGGGDGTLASFVNLVAAEQQAAAAAASRQTAAPAPPLPPLAVLRMGTGNALAGITGACRDVAGDLTRLVAACRTGGAAALPVVRVPLLELRYQQAGQAGEEKGEEGVLCFFAGAGFDALMLTHYNRLKQRTVGSLFRKWVHSPAGYVIALFSRTLPATFRGEHIFQVRVTNMGEEAFYVDPQRGDWATPRPHGAVLYEGPAGIASFSTVPFYGGGVKLFPFAGLCRGGFAQLRLSHINPLVGALNTWGIWRGTYRQPKWVFDFIFSEVLIEFDRPIPLQQSGDLCGEVQRLLVRVREGDAQLVDATRLARGPDEQTTQATREAPR